MNRAVFLDRDGVVNRAIVRNGRPFPPRTADELEIPNESVSSLRKLRDAGYILIVVTNQPDVARGKATLENINSINSKIMTNLPIEKIYMCTHDDKDRCTCRKPKPGMLIEAANEYSISMKDSYLIGDRWKDIDAGRAAGCQTAWIDYGYDEPKPKPNFVGLGIEEVTDWIVSRINSDSHLREI